MGNLPTRNLPNPEPINLSNVSYWKVEAADPLRLDDYEVCKLLTSYVWSCVHMVECGDLLVEKVVIERTRVRAYVSKENSIEVDGAVVADFTERQLPRGLYERALDLSHGPFTPFHPPVVPEDVKVWLGRLHQVAFPAPTPRRSLPGTQDSLHYPQKPDPLHIVLTANDCGVLRKWMGARMDTCTETVKVRRGFCGTLYEVEEVKKEEYTSLLDDGEPEKRRSVSVWASRSVPVGSVRTADREPPPDWTSSPLQVIEKDTFEKLDQV